MRPVWAPEEPKGPPARPAMPPAGPMAVEKPPGLRGEDGHRLTLSSKIFEEKTAREKAFQYDGVPLHNGHEWRSDTFDYFVSKCPAAGPWLSWAENHGAEDVTAEGISETLRENALMTDDLQPEVLSHHVWGFLQHCLSGAGKQIFKGTARQDGFNVWRKLTLEINSRTDCVRHALRNQCQQVGQASSAAKVWQTITDWESLYTRYREAGGGPMEFEDRRGQFLRILPNDMRREAFRRLNEFKSLPSLKEWVREQLEYERDWGMLGHSVPAKALSVEPQGTDRVFKPSAEDIEALLALEADSPEELVLAVQKKFQKFFPRRANTSPGAPPGGGGKGGGKAGGKNTRCANFGKTGHIAAECRGEKRDFDQRPCYNCGKPGHVKQSALNPKRW